MRLRDYGYRFKVPEGWSISQYRLYACFLLENNDLLHSYPQPVRVSDLETLYLEEMGMKVEYREGLYRKYSAWGVTISQSNSAPEIILDKSLQDPTDRGRQRLLKSTLAHELGHAFLHSQLVSYRAAAYVGSLDHLLLDDGKPKFSIDDVWSKKDNYFKSDDLIEFQANQIMVGLLMPFTTLTSYIAKTVVPLLNQYQEKDGHNAWKVMESRWLEFFRYIVRWTAECFDLSHQMVAIELKRLFLNKAFNGAFLGNPEWPRPSEMV